jgi:hypothetical protein
VPTELEAPVEILSLREWKISVAGECTESEESSTLRAVGSLLRKSWVKSLKESEESSSGGIVPPWEQTKVKVRTGRNFGTAKSPKRKGINGQCSQEEIAKSR